VLSFYLFLLLFDLKVKNFFGVGDEEMCAHIGSEANAMIRISGLFPHLRQH
jgi:hypothetical protein